MYVAEQVVPQLMPVGAEVTLPLPDLLTVRVYVLSVNVAVTDLAAVTDTVQTPVAFVQAPDHPAKIEPTAGGALKTTLVP